MVAGSEKKIANQLQYS